MPALIRQNLAVIFGKRFWRDRSGTIAIETAFVAPVLALLSIGAFQVSALVARQQELQSGAAEAATIALARTPTSETSRNTLRDIVRTSLGLAEGQVIVTNLFRCGTRETYALLISDCDSADIVATYLRIEIKDTFVPDWTQLGIGSPVELNVVRTVQIS